MTTLQTVGFDYGTLPMDKAVSARAAAERIQFRMARTAQDIIEIGRDLIDQKESVGHGHFLEWIEAEFGLS